MIEVHAALFCIFFVGEDQREADIEATARKEFGANGFRLFASLAFDRLMPEVSCFV